MFPPIAHRYGLQKHSEVKPKLLKIIDNLIEEDPSLYSYETMSHSDYILNTVRTYRPPYEVMVRRLVMPALKDYAHRWGYKDVRNVVMWFARYHDGGTFGWHSHEQCNCSAVYMLELPTDESSTQYYGIEHEPLKEGHIFVCPAMIPHRSPIINDGRKTVIGLGFDVSVSSLGVK